MTSDETSTEIYVGEPSEFYVDTFFVGASAYTVSLHLGIKSGPNTTRQEASIHMSPQHAKVMAILFKRAIKKIEEQFGSEIPLPERLLRDKEIELERDW